MIRNPRAAVSVAIGGALVAVCALAAARQGPAGSAPDAPKAAAPRQVRTWTIEYDEAVHSDKTGEGSAKVVKVTTDEGTVLHAQVFTWNDKTKTAHASGDLRMTDPQADAVGTEAEIQYARDKKLVILKGMVHLTLKPKEKDGPQGGAAAAKDAGASEEDHSAAALRRYPVEITCDRLEYRYARDVKHAVLTGSFKAVQKLPDKTRTLLADKAEWFGVEEKIVLHGPVHWEDTKGQTGDTKSDVTVFTKEGDERLQTSRGKITMPVDEDEEKPAAAPPEKAKGAPPGSKS